MRVGLAVVPGGFTSAVASVVDVLRTADALRADVDPAIAPWEITVLAGTRPGPGEVRTGAGFVVPTAGPVARLRESQLVLVAAYGQLDAAGLFAALRSSESRALLDELVSLPGSLPVAAACTGTFALAEAGLLDRRRATTSWWLSADFRTRYPRSTLDMASMVVEDGRTTTAGAAFGHVDLALTLVGRVSVELAALTARFLLLDHRSTQSEYVAIGHLARRDQLVAEFERHVRAHLDQPVDLAAVARLLGTSRRTLERRVGATVGLSPLQMVHRLRVERARHLLRTTDRTVDDVARDVGYLNATTLRALLRRFPAAGDRAEPVRGAPGPT